MNISIIGPENSGKTTLAIQYAKRLAFGRPVYFLGVKQSNFEKISIEEYALREQCVVIVDDANAFLDSYELNRKDSPLRNPLIMHRHMNRINIFIFHSVDDAIKFVFRQSRFIIISDQYRDSAYKRNKFIKGIIPEKIGRKGFEFLSYKRY